MNNEELENYSEEILNTVSRNVVRIRREKKLTQMQLAMKIGMKNSSYLGKVERRKDNAHFNLKHLSKISKVLDVDITEFFKNK